MQKSFNEIQTKDIMSTNVVAAEPGDDVLDIAKTMVARNFKGIPVVDKNQKLLGMISMKELIDNDGIYLPTMADIVSRLKLSHPQDLPGMYKKIKVLSKLKAGSIMNASPIYLFDYAFLDEAVHAFILHSVEILPVVNTEYKLVGVVTKNDVLKNLVEPVENLKLRTEMTGEIESKNVMTDLEKNVVVVSSGRAKFWFATGLVFLIIGIIIAYALILRVQLK